MLTHSINRCTGDCCYKCFIVVLSYCSVQDVLDGVDDILDTILMPLNAIIEDLVEAARSFSWPLIDQPLQSYHQSHNSLSHVPHRSQFDPLIAAVTLNGTHNIPNLSSSTHTFVLHLYIITLYHHYPLHTSPNRIPHSHPHSSIYSYRILYCLSPICRLRTSLHHHECCTL